MSRERRYSSWLAGTCYIIPTFFVLAPIDPQHNQHNSDHHDDVRKYDIPNMLGEMRTIGYQWNCIVINSLTTNGAYAPAFLTSFVIS